MKKNNLKKVAVFDIDGTLFRSSLLRELLENLISSGVFPQKAQQYYAHAYINWIDRKGPYEDYINGIVGAYERYIKGVRQHVVWDIAHHVMDFHQNRLYRYTRNLVRELRDKKYYLLAISGSPFDIVEPFARTLGFNKVYGRIFDIDKDERFTGKILYQELISHKGRILKRAVEKEGLTLKGSVGVGDTDSDIDFLKLVERPVAFNPNIKLYKYAKKHNWEIAVERKDVIYKL